MVFFHRNKLRLLYKGSRIKGLEASYKEAARLILCELWQNWQLDLNNSENESYVKFLESI